MRQTLTLFVVFALMLPLVGATRAQEQADPVTLLPQSVLDAIADEVSGALAFNHTLELGSYERDRLREEYEGTYRESEYISRMARLYGLSDVQIERFRQERPTWDAEQGDLWMIEPQKRLIISYRDVTACLATGSRSADVTAELVYVGRGDRESDYQGRDVKGKIVLASGPVGAAHTQAVLRFGAAGVVSFFNGTGKPVDHPDQIGWSGIGGFGGPQGAQREPTFGFILSHRMGMELLDRLERGQKVVVRAQVKTTEYPADMEVTTATIPGDGTTDQEIMIVAHLFEGIAKQGAGDNFSGSATILEVGRAMVKLIKEGILPRPKRTIRFLWVPEISGTTAYLRAHPDEAKRIVAAINMDMVGINLTKNGSALRLYRNPDSLASFVSDVAQQFFEYVGETNREKVHNRRIAYAFSRPIVDPTGTRDPFYYGIEKYYGSSDHVVLVNMGIPAIFFNHWPDKAYHTSEDRPWNLDPTQLKRTAFIGVATASILASASATDAVRLATLSSGYAQKRIGEAMTDAMKLLSQSQAADLPTNYKEAVAMLTHAYEREARTLASVKTMAIGSPTDPAVTKRIERIEAELRAGQTNDMARLRSAFQALAEQFGVSTAEPELTPAERTAAALVPVRKSPAPSAPSAGPTFQQASAGETLTGFHAMEARAYADGTRSILEIRQHISAELGPVPIERVIAFFRELEKRGEVEIRSR